MAIQLSSHTCSTNGPLSSTLCKPCTFSGSTPLPQWFISSIKNLWKQIRAFPETSILSNPGTSPLTLLIHELIHPLFSPNPRSRRYTSIGDKSSPSPNGWSWRWGGGGEKKLLVWTDSCSEEISSGAIEGCWWLPACRSSSSSSETTWSRSLRRISENTSRRTEFLAGVWWWHFFAKPQTKDNQYKHTRPTQLIKLQNIPDRPN